MLSGAEACAAGRTALWHFMALTELASVPPGGGCGACCGARLPGAARQPERLPPLGNPDLGGDLASSMAARSGSRVYLYKMTRRGKAGCKRMVNPWQGTPALASSSHALLTHRISLAPSPPTPVPCWK